MKITIVAGARPNFMKISPIINEIEKQNAKGVNISYRLVHTGQHYDKKMSLDFFKQLNIPEPHINLMAGGGTQAEQTASIMIAFEKDLINNPSDLVVVVGDVTSTMACSIVAKKQNVKLAHIEAGIRSFDDTMPEEINRRVTDCIADYFFTTTELAGENLCKIGVDKSNIFFVGNVMIDTLHNNLDRLIKPKCFDNHRLEYKNYFVITLHRPNNVDNPSNLSALMNAINNSVRGHSVIFPVHPRTKAVLSKLRIDTDNIKMVEPMGYLEFIYLVKNSKAVITDSGGITEEATVLGVPCMTIRNNTERPETCTIGTNELLGTDPMAIPIALNKLFEGKWKDGKIPKKWDGKAAERIVKHILKTFSIKHN